MPRTFGLNSIHASQIVGYCEAEHALVEVPPIAPDDADRAIAALVAERIPDRRHDPGRHRRRSPTRCSPPARPPRARHPHRAAVRRDHGARRGRRRHRHAQEAAAQQGRHDVRARHAARCTTSCTRTRAGAAAGRLGQRPARDRPRGQLRLDQRDDGGRPLRPVRVGDDRGPLLVLERRPGRLRPRRDVLRRAARRSSCCTRRPRNGRSRIRARLTEGSVVTTLKNTVDNVVTEYGIAELRGRSIAERARALIAIAHPDHRETLEREAREAGICGERGRRPVDVVLRDGSTARVRVAGARRRARPCATSWPASDRRRAGSGSPRRGVNLDRAAADAVAPPDGRALLVLTGAPERVVGHAHVRRAWARARPRSRSRSTGRGRGAGWPRRCSRTLPTPPSRRGSRSSWRSRCRRTTG